MSWSRGVGVVKKVRAFLVWVLGFMMERHGLGLGVGIWDGRGRVVRRVWSDGVSAMWVYRSYWEALRWFGVFMLGWSTARRNEGQ
jgi:hypothetical protein